MKPQTSQAAYNKSVEAAYFKILKLAKQQLAAIEHEELRYSLIRKEEMIVYEFVNPLIYLRLECNSYGLYLIHYGIETFDSSNEYSKVTALFVRSIYSLTSKQSTEIDIESSVNTDWLITNCSELYSYTEDRNKHHTFMLLKYKPAAVKRKQMKAVA
jgi:hypothetical protein